MSSLSDSLRGSSAHGEDWRGQYPPAPRPDHGGLPLGLVVTGAVVVGLGLLAWYELGPDLRRYLKISSM